MTRRDEWRFFWTGLLIGATLMILVCAFVANRAATALSDHSQQTIERWKTVAENYRQASENYRQRAKACEEK